MSQDGAGGRRLGISHLQSVFVFLLLGESVALVTLIIEMMIPKEH
jgi:F0F1-type ATP synthase membrane subunit c/vacuolar-type H+-ATPase subunit K